MRHLLRFGSAALVIGLASPLAAQGRAPIYTPGKLDANQQLARDIYKELIEINTGMTTGSVTPAANAMAKRFRDAGIPESDIFVGGPRPERFNVVARIHGRGGPNARKPLLLLAHIDVVEALKADWSPDLDPFVFTERDGYYYGRGTADDKAMASIFVANALRMVREKYVPDRDIIIALTADEEGGGSNGVDWLLKNHRELVDAALVINEGGGGTLTGSGMDVKPLFNSIQAAEKVYQDFTVTAANPGGHSSVPRPDNAIYELADALARLARFSFPVALNPTTRAFFEQTAKVETPETASAMRALVANPNDSAAAAFLSRDLRYASMLRTTCVATRLAGGHAYNALPQTASANVNCRMVPTSSSAETRATLTRVFADTGIKITNTQATEPDFPKSTPAVDPALLAATTDITKAMFGDIPVVPTMSTGATDSHYLRAVGIPSYGVSGIFSLPVETNAHGRDEKLRVKSYYDGLEFLDQLVRRLTGGVQP